MTLYHLIQRSFLGTTLYPLNRLRDIDRRRFDHQKEKYKGRESLCEWELESFDCLWNDVVHLSPIHPKDIFTALEEAGQRELKKRGPYFFAIDPERVEPRTFDPFNAIFFHSNCNGQEENYESTKIEKYSTLPDATKKYYREAIARREHPLLWNFTTHVLYHGEIDVSNVPIIDRHGTLLEDRTKIFGE